MAVTLSTAFSLMTLPRNTEIVRSLDIEVRLALQDGSRIVVV